MAKKICLLLLGGPIPEMGKRLEKSIQYVKENPENEYYFVATGLFDELNFFTEELERKGFKSTANVFSWDTLSNLEESFTAVWIDDTVVSTGKWHGMRVKKLHKTLKKVSGIYNLSTIQIVDSGEREDWKSVFLFFMYYYLWSARLISKLAKKLRIK